MRAAAKERVWGPTSRGVALQPLGCWTISKGVLDGDDVVGAGLIEARVVVWLEPTGPVTRMSPLG